MKEQWGLTQAALDKLLAWLDPDRDQAGKKLKEIRGKLSKFFEWRGCLSPEEYVDITIDRVAKIIFGGKEQIQTTPYKYIHGVALKVLRECWRKQRELPPPIPPDVPDESEQEAEFLNKKEQQFECLEQCIQKLSFHDQKLIIQYYQGKQRVKIENRQQLAKQLTASRNALSIRIYRLKDELKKCVEACLKGSKKD